MCLEQSPCLRRALSGWALSLEVVYRDPVMEVWVALRGAEGSNENILQNIFGFNCIYLLSALSFISVDKVDKISTKNWSISFFSTGMSTLLHAPIQALGQQTEVCEGFNSLVLKMPKYITRICVVKIKNVGCLENKPLYSHKILLKLNIPYFEVSPDLIGISLQYK